MLDIKNLSASIDGKKILDGFDLKIKPGEVHAIMGPNGSGKSTLANVLTGKNGYEISGELSFKGENLKKISVEIKSNGQVVTKLETFSSNVGEIDYYHRSY